MELSVKNLGPIKSGKIDLDKRFTVFVGYNNSGKTYMSQLIWGIFDTFPLFDFIIKAKTTSNINFSFDKPFFITENLVKDYLQEFQEYLELEGLPVILRLQQNNQTILKGISIKFDKFSLKKIETTSYQRDYKSFQDNKLYLQVDSIKKEGSLQVKVTQNIKNSALYEQSLELNKKPLHTPKYLIGRTIFGALFDFRQVFFLPSDRTFFPKYFNYIQLAARRSQEIIQKYLSNPKKFSNEDFEKLSEIPYSKATEQLISAIENLSLANGGNDFYQPLIETLEEILGGKITNELNTVEGISSNLAFGLNLKDKVKLPIKLASSSANQLTTLYLYLKYWAKAENNFLIIDEPEQNLHPKNQLKLLDILMRFANQNNNRVLINTHSPLLTEAINNYLHLGYLKSEMEPAEIENFINQSNLDVDLSSAMSHEDLGVYFFDGRSIKEYEVNDYGVFFRDFRKEEKEVETTANALKNAIYDLKNTKKVSA